MDYLLRGLSFATFPALPIAVGIDRLRTMIAGPVADSVDQARRENSSLIAAVAGGALVVSAIVIYKGVKK